MATEAVEILTGAARPILDRWFESEELKATIATDAVIGAYAPPSHPGTAYVLAGDCTDPSAPTVATVTGTAEDLLLALWRRTGLDRLAVTGDADAARATFALALTP